MTADYRPEQVLDLWFPDDGHWETPEAHAAFWQTRMHGGMDEIICRDFSGLTVAAAQGLLDDWAETPRGRLALLIALDQFPRSLWRDTPAAFGQDIKSARLALDGVRLGHFDALEPSWERQFYVIALFHCEGPDHLDRLDLCADLTERVVAAALPQLRERVEATARGQFARGRAVIECFGRHPHRNPIYGRVSTPEEQAYIDLGDFPHLPPPAQPTATTPPPRQSD
jgi:uncharacterized protein (DUF924 family)